MNTLSFIAKKKSRSKCCLGLVPKVKRIFFISMTLFLFYLLLFLFIVILLFIDPLEDDKQAVNNFMRIKLKQLSTGSFFDNVLPLLTNHPIFPSLALKQFVYQEMMPSKQFNIRLLTLIVRVSFFSPSFIYSLIFWVCLGFNLIHI